MAKLKEKTALKNLIRVGGLILLAVVSASVSSAQGFEPVTQTMIKMVRSECLSADDLNPLNIYLAAKMFNLPATVLRNDEEEQDEGVIYTFYRRGPTLNLENYILPTRSYSLCFSRIEEFNSQVNWAQEETGLSELLKYLEQSSRTKAEVHELSLGKMLVNALLVPIHSSNGVTTYEGYALQRMEQSTFIAIIRANLRQGINNAKSDMICKGEGTTFALKNGKLYRDNETETETNWVGEVVTLSGHPYVKGASPVIDTSSHFGILVEGEGEALKKVGDLSCSPN